MNRIVEPCRRSSPRVIVVAGLLFATAVSLRAQEAAPEDQAIDTIRTLPQISAQDQRRIAEWVQVQLGKLTATREDRQAAAQVFRKTLVTQFENAGNTPAFKGQLAAQTAQIAAAQFADPKTDRWSGFALARALVDFNLPDALPGLFAGLQSPLDAVRYLSATGLASLKSVIESDKQRLDPTLQALRGAIQAETSPVALARMYEALAFANQVPTVLDVFLAAFEKRLSARRTGAGTADSAEIEAFEYFRTPVVLQALNPDQRAQLARPLAVFLRLDAERYNTAGLRFDEIDMLERRLDAVESILSDMVGAGKGGKIRDELAAGGYEKRASVLAEAQKWIGGPEPGPLSAAPFNVPLGAP